MKIIKEDTALNAEQNAADFIVKEAENLSIEFGKIIAGLISAGVKNLAAILLAALKPVERQPKETSAKGRVAIEKLLGGGHIPAIFQIPHQDLAAFKSEAKKFKLPYAVIQGKTTPSADIVIREKDGALFNRMCERLGYGRVAETASSDRSKPVYSKSDVAKKEKQSKTNPTMGKRVPRSASETDLQTLSPSAKATAENTLIETVTATAGTMVTSDSYPAGKIEYLADDGTIISHTEYNRTENIISAAKGIFLGGTETRITFYQDKDTNPPVEAITELTKDGYDVTVTDMQGLAEREAQPLEETKLLSQEYYDGIGAFDTPQSPDLPKGKAGINERGAEGVTGKENQLSNKPKSLGEITSVWDKLSAAAETSKSLNSKATQDKQITKGIRGQAR
jgi:hypothetical protein